MSGRQNQQGKLAKRIQRPELADAIRDDKTVNLHQTLFYALAIWPNDIVSRATLRAFLPVGDLKPVGAVSHWRNEQLGEHRSKNVVSESFQKHLKAYERDGLIQRGHEFIRIVGDRRVLFDEALEGVPDPRHRKFLLIEQAASIIEQQLAQERRPKVLAIRRQELRFIKSLMTPEGYDRDARRRTVRHEAGQITVPLGETAARWKKSRK